MHEALISPFVEMDGAVLRSSFSVLTSYEGISVPPGTGLVDVASELELELRFRSLLG